MIMEKFLANADDNTHVLSLSKVCMLEFDMIAFGDVHVSEALHWIFKICTSPRSASVSINR
jgi:hypothetical protein